MPNIFTTDPVASRSYLNPLSLLGRDQKGMPRKMENKLFVSPSQQCSSTPAGFGQEFLTKEQRDNIGAFRKFSWPGSSWFLSVPNSEIGTEVTEFLWCYYIIKNTMGELKRLSQNGLEKCFQHLYSRCKKCIAAHYFEGNVSYIIYCLVFLRNKVIPGKYWSYHVFVIAMISTF